MPHAPKTPAFDILRITGLHPDGIQATQVAEISGIAEQSVRAYLKEGERNGLLYRTHTYIYNKWVAVWHYQPSPFFYKSQEKPAKKTLTEKSIARRAYQKEWRKNRKAKNSQAGGVDTHPAP